MPVRFASPSDIIRGLAPPHATLFAPINSAADSDTDAAPETEYGLPGARDSYV